MVQQKQFSGSTKKLFQRKRPCTFCLSKAPTNYIDYKDESQYIRLINMQGKIMSSRITGTCAKHQRAVSLAIKRARYVGIIPFYGPIPASIIEKFKKVYNKDEKREGYKNFNKDREENKSFESSKEVKEEKVAEEKVEAKKVATKPSTKKTTATKEVKETKKASSTKEK
ncbi:30S ribosomal protein S18 [Chlamydia abortus]|nr:30S ribosomal protein S18 [Chlamydia abortus]